VNHRVLLRGLPLAVVVAVAAVAVVLAVLGHWKRGAAAMAAASGLALVLRVVLPGRHVGALAVRSRRFDIAFLLVLTGLLTAAAIALVNE
jgi:hypothetical protein